MATLIISLVLKSLLKKNPLKAISEQTKFFFCIISRYKNSLQALEMIQFTRVEKENCFEIPPKNFLYRGHFLYLPLFTYNFHSTSHFHFCLAYIQTLPSTQIIFVLSAAFWCWVELFTSDDQGSKPLLTAVQGHEELFRLGGWGRWKLFLSIYRYILAGGGRYSTFAQWVERNYI